MKAPGTLRGRLALAMVAVFLLALAASAFMNHLGRPKAGTLPAALVDDEPYQDALVLAGFSLPALLLIWLVSSWSLRPLVRASAEAQRVGPLDPAARLSREGLPAEITPLVDAVNGALDRMAAAFEAERRFTENAAHELRTPLAVLAMRLQRARQAPEGAIDWAAIDGDMAQMTRLVSQLLDLARKEHAGRAASGARMNLARVAREACAMVLPLLETQGRVLDIDVPETLAVQGQADDVRDALRNLLENAALHGRGTVALQGAARNGGVALIVSDHGGGVPAEMQEAVFERFRKDRSSAGTGLGLAIVREVARAHGGRVGFMPGDVCSVEFWLPG